MNFALFQYQFSHDSGICDAFQAFYVPRNQFDKGADVRQDLLLDNILVNIYLIV